MKKCSQCGRVYSDLINTCSYCGAPLGGTASSSAKQPTAQQSYTPPVQPVTPPIQPVKPPIQPVKPPIQPVTPPIQPVTPPIQPITPPTAPSAARENVGKGILGAFLFSIGGLIVQIILINVEIISALAGIATYLLAITGYQKFSGVGSGNSKKALWISIPISLLMLCLGTFMGYGVYGGRVWGIPASEALQRIQMDQELMNAVTTDLGKTVAFWGVSVAISLVSSRKKK